MVERQFTLLDEFIPLRSGKAGVRGGEDGYDMVFGVANGAFSFVCAVVGRREILHVFHGFPQVAIK